MFTRILCGVDETPEAIEAVRQARRLTLPETELLLVDVLDMNAVVHAGWAANELLHDMRNEQLAALEVARVAAGDHVETRLIRGVPWSEIAGTAREENVDLVATYVLHEAPCSVLIARPCGEPELYPRSIVAGFDGSDSSRAALAVARQIADRSKATLRVVAAAGGAKLPLDPIREHAPDAHLDHRPPLDALIEESADADLVVVGSRGLHGLAAVGSVSERVAHQAKSSVLVVRSGTTADR
jgi:nucleotide-binding universal stress UspA family protein